MSYILIKGFFHVIGQSPDGDSIKFIAENPVLWEKINTDHKAIFSKKLAEIDPRTGTAGFVNLRFQGIDALETHYTPSTPTPPDDAALTRSSLLTRPIATRYSQPSVLGKAASECLLSMIGILDTSWHRFGYISEIRVKDGRYEKRLGMDDLPHALWELPGYVIVRDVERRGRPISWVFAGTTRTRDGSNISRKQLRSRISRSLNYQLLEKGLVYPYFYMTLPSLFRDELIKAAEKSRLDAEPLAKNKRMRNGALRDARRAAQMNGLPLPEKLPNVWIYDQTLQGLKINHVDHVVNGFEMWPYLFRKMVKAWHHHNTHTYWGAVQSGNVDTVIDWGKIDLDTFFDAGDSYVFIVSELDFVRLSEVIEIRRGRLKMRVPPHDIVFLS